LNIDPKQTKEEIPEVEEIIAMSNVIIDSERRELQIKNMIDKTKSEIIRLGIEIQIYKELLKKVKDAKRSVYENRINTFAEELQYNEQRKSILENMLASI